MSKEIRDRTTIGVRRETFDQLRKLGRYGDSMDKIIQRLLKRSSVE